MSIVALWATCLGILWKGQKDGLILNVDLLLLYFAYCLCALVVTHTIQPDSSSTDDAISTVGSGVWWFLVECKY